MQSLPYYSAYSSTIPLSRMLISGHKVKQINQYKIITNLKKIEKKIMNIDFFLKTKQ